LKPWYEELFTNYAETYDRECFVQGTEGECDFIETEIGSDRRRRILDIGCGAGRHAIELSRRGYSVVGVDLSETQLAKARAKATEAGTAVRFERMDARELIFAAEFDLTIMLCEGAFPLMESDEMNYSILQGAARALKPKGKFIFTTLNGLYPLLHIEPQTQESPSPGASDGGSRIIRKSFDLMTFRDRNTYSIPDDAGNTRELACDERYYVPSEITWLLKSLGFINIGIFGAKLGALSRNDRLTPDDFEMLVIAERP